MKIMDTFQVHECTQIHLTTGEVFVLDNDMKTKQSCTEWDVHRFFHEGILKEVKEGEKYAVCS